MKVLVTGGAGFIGSHIVDELLGEKAQVIVVDNLITGQTAHIPPDVPFYQVDIRSQPELEQVFATERPDYVMHQAAQVSVQKSLDAPAEDSLINIAGTINVLDCCVKYKVKKLVFASSAAVYGRPQYLPIDEEHPVQPISFYGLSKLAAEAYIRQYGEHFGLNYTILRYANVYGMRQDAYGEAGVISIFIDKVLRKQPVTIYGDGSQTRDFIFVKDVARANILALSKGDGQILNISCQQQVSLNKLVEVLASSTGQEIKIEYQPPRAGDIDHSYLSNQKAQGELSWKPRYALLDGLQETIDYQKEKRFASIVEEGKDNGE